MTPSPQEVLKMLWKADGGKLRGRFPWGLRVEYEEYSLFRGEFEPYRYDLYRITRFVEEEGGQDTDKRLGSIGIGTYGMMTRSTDESIVFNPDTSLPIADLAPIIVLCKKAGFKVHIDKSSDLSTLLDTAAVLAQP